MALAVLNEINLIDQVSNYSSRWGARVRFFCLHTEEGNQTARGLHDWMIRNGVSYHYVLGGGLVIDHVDTDFASWSALDANPYTINLVFAGSKAAQSRQVWIDKYLPDIRNAAILFVQDAKKYDPLEPVVLAQDYKAIGSGKTGAMDHSGITYGLGIGDHTDVGKNFPWDLFLNFVKEALLGIVVPPVVTVPVAKEIDKEAARAAAWIGKRIDEHELACPDGVGRFVKYENAVIYWHPRSGAHAVPNFLYKVYADLGWEAGALGYPLGDHTVLEEGDVQSFEGGALYRRHDAATGFYVHGMIGQRWKELGFEKGQLGYPKSNEIANGNIIVQYFEKGHIAWSPEAIAIVPTNGPDTLIPNVHI